MTITRETLELAAKAADIDISGVRWRTWNPHTDARDAMELASKLHFLISFRDNDCGLVFEGEHVLHIHWSEDCTNWMEAVVMCAAEVQREGVSKWDDYPAGTKAHAVNGGHWTKTKHGWNWCTRCSFPTPGGDAFRVAMPTTNNQTADDKQ